MKVKDVMVAGNLKISLLTGTDDKGNLMFSDNIVEHLEDDVIRVTAFADEVVLRITDNENGIERRLYMEEI